MSTPTDFQEHLRSIRVCTEAREWAEGKTAQAAWDECERPGWLLWWIVKDLPERKIDIVRVACRIAKLVLHLVPPGEDRPRKAIEAAGKWADDPTDANLHLVKKARLEAYAAEFAVTGYVTSAANAAEAAANAAEVAADESSGAVATANAAYAAYAATAKAAYAAEATAEEIKCKSLAILRQVFTCPWGGDSDR